MRRGNVVTNTPGGYERILEKIRSGKTVYFEESFEEIALKYIPGPQGESGKYYAKFYGHNEYEILHSSNIVWEAMFEGRIIRKSRYENYHLVKYY